MNATAENGDIWTGERDGDWWMYQDSAGLLYESKEVPAYRIVMDNAALVMVDGKPSICPIAGQ